jgi:hypothetical protein
MSSNITMCPLLGVILQPTINNADTINKRMINYNSFGIIQHQKKPFIELLTHWSTIVGGNRTKQ